MIEWRISLKSRWAAAGSGLLSAGLLRPLASGCNWKPVTPPPSNGPSGGDLTKAIGTIRDVLAAADDPLGEMAPSPARPSAAAHEDHRAARGVLARGTSRPASSQAMGGLQISRDPERDIYHRRTSASW